MIIIITWNFYFQARWGIRWRRRLWNERSSFAGSSIWYQFCWWNCYSAHIPRISSTSHVSALKLWKSYNYKNFVCLLYNFDSILRAQRSKLPDVVTAVVPKPVKETIRSSVADLFKVSSEMFCWNVSSWLWTDFNDAVLSNFSCCQEEKIIPSVHRPSEQWQRQQISNFSDLRYKVEVNREEWTRIGSIDFVSKIIDVSSFVNFLNWFILMLTAQKERRLVSVFVSTLWY